MGSHITARPEPPSTPPHSAFRNRNSPRPDKRAFAGYTRRGVILLPDLGEGDVGVSVEFELEDPDAGVQLHRGANAPGSDADLGADIEPHEAEDEIEETLIIAFMYRKNIPGFKIESASSNNSPMVCFIIGPAPVDNIMDTSVLPRLAITKVYPFVGSTGAPLYQARMHNCLPLDHIMPCRFEAEPR